MNSSNNSSDGTDSKHQDHRASTRNKEAKTAPEPKEKERLVIKASARMSFFDQIISSPLVSILVLIVIVICVVLA